jgi:hypothetical protein
MPTRRLGGKWSIADWLLRPWSDSLIVGFAKMRLDRFVFKELAGVMAEAMRRLETPPQVHRGQFWPFECKV